MLQCGATEGDPALLEPHARVGGLAVLGEEPAHVVEATAVGADGVAVEQLEDLGTVVTRSDIMLGMTDEELARLIAVVQTPERRRETLEARVQLLEDHRALTELTLLYGMYCDGRRWDELLDLYTDDFERTLLGTLDEKVKGKEKLRQLYEAPVLPRADDDAAGPPPAAQISTYELRHMIHPPVVRIADDDAHATVAAVYSLVASRGDGPTFERGEHEGGYIFGFRKDDGRWRFESMVVISENARNPLFSAS